MNSIRKSRRAGFTMIEMMIVIAVVGMMAGMLTVALIRARRLSQQVKCASQLGQIGQTINLMMMNNSLSYPTLQDPESTINAIPWWAQVYSQWATNSPLDTVKDDSTTPATLGIQLPSTLPGQMQTFQCPSAGRLHIPDSAATPADNLISLNNSISYGMNFDVMDANKKQYHAARHSVIPVADQGRYSEKFPDPTASPAVPSTLDSADKRADQYYAGQVKHPSEFILISEANTTSPDPSTWTGGRISMDTTGRDAGDAPKNPSPITPRHEGRANVLFADMHVEAVEINETVSVLGNYKNINNETRLWTLPDD